MDSLINIRHNNLENLRCLGMKNLNFAVLEKASEKQTSVKYLKGKFQVSIIKQFNPIIQFSHFPQHLYII